jgi:hypothetical protein
MPDDRKRNQITGDWYTLRCKYLVRNGALTERTMGRLESLLNGPVFSVIRRPDNNSDDMALQIDTLAKCALGSSDVKPGEESVRDGAEGTGDLSGFGSPISLDGQDGNDMAICLSSNVQTFASEGGPEADMECGCEDGECD